MARSICPSCGEPFNGKKCRNCEYEAFGDIRSPELHGHRDSSHTCAPGQPHTHTGAYSRTSNDTGGAPLRPKTRQGKKPPAALIIILVLLLAGPVLNLLGAVIFGIVQAVNHIPSSFSQNISLSPEPEPIQIGDTAEVVYSDGGFTVWADWAGNPVLDSIPIVVENHTGQNVNVSAREILVQGNFMLEDGFLYVSAPKGQSGMGTFYLDSPSITGIQQVSFRLHIYDDDTYETILETDPITLTSSDGTPPAPVPEPTGTPVTQTEDIRVYYLGLDADPEEFTSSELRFCLVNSSEQTLDFFTNSTQVNGEDADLALWSELPPHTMTYTTVYLFDLEDLGIRRRTEVQSIQFHLQAYDGSGTYGDYGTIDLPSFTITP